MNIVAVVYQILMMLMIALAGLALRKRGIMTAAVIKGTSGIVLKAALPAMLVMLTQREVPPDARMGFLRVMLISLPFMAVTCWALYVIGRKRMQPGRAAVFAAIATMPNAGFMGLPIVQALYGDIGAMYLVAYIIAFNLILYTLLERIMAPQGTNPLASLVNIGSAAIVVSLVLFIFDIRLPTPLSAFFSQLGGLTIPLSMLIAGARLADLKVSALKDKGLWLAMGIKMLALPLMAWALGVALGMQGVELGVVMLGTAMPTAAAVQMLAERYDTDPVYAAAGVSLSTFMCLLTVPLLIWITRI